MPPFEARYIDVVWADEDNVLKIDVSRYSIEIAEKGDSYALESVTYHDYYPRLAFKILRQKHYHIPYFELPSGEKVKLLKVLSIIGWRMGPVRVYQFQEDQVQLKVASII